MAKHLIKYLSGTEEAIDLPPLTNTELYDFINLLVEGKTPQIVALNCHRKIEWVNELDFECYNRLAKECVRLNFPKAMVISANDPIAGLKVGPLLFDLHRTLVLMDGMPSAPTPGNDTPTGNNSLKLPAQPDSAEATGQESAAIPLSASAGTSLPGTAAVPSPASI